MAWYNSDSFFCSVYFGFVRHRYQGSPGDDSNILGVGNMPMERGSVAGAGKHRYDSRGYV